MKRTTNPQQPPDSTPSSPRPGWQPPRGIQLLERADGRNLARGLLWWVEGKRKRKWFKTAEARETFGRALTGDVKAHGTAAYRLDQDEALRWRSFMARVGADADLEAVAALWLQHGKPPSELTIAKAVTAYTAAKTMEGVDAASISHYSPIFDRLEAFAGARRVSDITRDDVRDFMEKHGGDSADTRRSRFARVRALFNWLVEEGKVDRSPFAGIKAPKVKAKPAIILTVAQTRSLFAKNESQPRELLGRLALEAFCGLRHDTAGQIVADEIHPEGLRIPASKIKTAQDQFLEGLPANLHAWLTWAKPETWHMDQRQYLEAKSDAFTRANIPHPRNCLRKSFASYHVAAFGNKALTAIIMCHSDGKLLEKTYRGVAKHADGVEYFAILPPSK